MLIAIQLTGYFRGYKQVYQSFVDNILKLRENHTVDIFIDTWDSLHVDDSYAFLCGNDVGDISVKLDVADIMAKYEPRKIRIDKWDDIKELTLCEKFYSPEVLILLKARNDEFISSGSTAPITMRNGYSLIASQFYKFHGSSQLRKEYEQEKGIKYDIVAKTRPDVLFHRPLDVNEIRPEYFYSNEKYGDLFVCGSDTKVDIFCNVLHNMKRIVDEHKSHPFDFPSDYHMHSCEFFEEWNLLDNGIGTEQRRYLGNFCQIFRQKRN